MDELGIEHRLTAVESKASSNVKRLDKLEPIVDEIHTMSKTMVQLVEEVKHTNDNVSNLSDSVIKIDNRMDEVEKAPGKEWSSTKKTFFTSIVSAIGTAFAIGVVMMIAQYI